MRCTRSLIGTPSGSSAFVHSFAMTYDRSTLSPASADAIPALRAAAIRTEEARGQGQLHDPPAVLDALERIVSGRWTLVDHFEHNGFRYVIAVENAACPPGLDLLSPREREVVERALQGLDNKVIAFDLGITHSTVKVLVARAALKVGVRTRSALLAKLRLRESR